MQPIFRKAGVFFLGLLYFWVLSACSTIKDVHVKDSTKSDIQEPHPAGIAGIDPLTGKAPKAPEPAAWEDGIRDLVLQMVSRLPAEGLLTVIVGDFREGRSGGRVLLSDPIESDIRTTMAGVEDIKVVDRDQGNADLLLTGLFRMDGDVLNVNATLKDMKTGTITAAGRVLIHATGIQAKDLMPPEFPLSYDFAVEQVLTVENSRAPFSVKVWTDKNQFRIGEPVTFYFRADRDCYITLLDQGTSGALRVIFPNPYQRDNFIRARKTYAVPDPATSYEIRVDGPPGIERVKAIASLNRLQFPGEISDTFFEVDPQDSTLIRDLTLSVKRLSEQQWTQGHLELDIVDPDSPEIGRPRKLRPKRPEKPVDIIGTPGAIEKESPGVIEPKPPGKPVDILGVPGVKPEEEMER